MALDVGVHDGFEMLEFAVLEEVDDVDLETSRKHHFNTDNNASCGLKPAPQGSLSNFNTMSRMNVFLLFFSSSQIRPLVRLYPQTKKRAPIYPRSRVQALNAINQCGAA